MYIYIERERARERESFGIAKGTGLMAFQCVLVLSQIILQNYGQLDKVY